MVSGTLGLSSPVGDSWESTHPCNDHLELENKIRKSEKKYWVTDSVTWCNGIRYQKKGYLIVVGAQVGNL